MAIHNDDPNIEVTICCDGKDLVEYAASNDEIRRKKPAVIVHQQRKTVTNYVEAVTGKSFVVVAKVNDTNQVEAEGLSFELYAEGKLVCSSLLVKQLHKEKSWSDTLIGPEARKRNQVFQREMIFAEISCDSRTYYHANDNSNQTGFQNLGSIRVLVYREKNAVESAPPDVSRIKNSVVYQERALIENAKSHTISFSDAKQSLSQYDWESNYMDGKDYPILIFHFKYRSKEILKRLEILKELPLPAPISLRQSLATILSPAQKEQVQAGLNPLDLDNTEVLLAATLKACIPVVPDVSTISTIPILSVPPVAPTLIAQHTQVVTAPNLLDPAQFQAQLALFSQFQMFVQSQTASNLQALPAPSPLPSQVQEATIKLESSNPMIKRERKDEEDDNTRKKPKKMLGKMIIDLTEDDNEEKIQESIEIED